MKIVTLLFIVFLLRTSVLFPHQFINLTVEDGLSSNHVNCVYQDHLGFMWFGTDRGLNRYDGISIRVFTHDPADSNSLSSNNINRVYEDENNTLWIGTQNGLNRFDPKTEKSIRYSFGESWSNSITRILAEGDSILWLGTMDELVRFRKKTGEFEPFVWLGKNGKRIQSKRRVYALVQLDDGCLAVGCALDDFYKFDPQTFKFYELHDTFAANRFGSGCGAYRDNEGLVWFGFSNFNGVYCLNQKTGHLKAYLNSKDTTFVNYPLISGINEDHDGNIWFATVGGGLTCYHKKAKSFTYCTPRIGVKGKISTSQTRDICVDKQGNIWCGSDDGGVNMLPRWSKNIRLHEQYPDEEKSIGYGTVIDLCEDLDGNVWVVSVGGGVAKISPDFSTAMHMLYSDQLPFKNKWEYQAVECDRNGNLWFCGNRVSVLNWRTKSIAFLTGPDIDSPGKIWPRSAWTSMSEDSLGNMWFGSVEAGLLRYDRNKRIRIFQHDPEDSTSLADGAVYSLMCDKRGTIWAGTGSGLSCLQPDKESFRTFHVYDSSQFGDCAVFMTFEDSRGLLWIAGSQGLFVFDRLKKCFIDRTVELGIEKQAVMAVLEDTNGELWVRTTTHLFRFDVEQHSATPLGHDDGLLGVNTNEWWGRDFFMGRTGHIYYGGAHIVGRFHPDSLYVNLDPPPVVLTDLEVNYKLIRPGKTSFLKTALPYAKELILPFDQNTFTLKYAALDYTAPHNNSYAYKLVGLHENWVQAGHQNVAAFTNLSPGRYTFHVIGSNNDGTWNDNGASLFIRILPPWYRTIWAYAGYFMFFFGALFAIYRFQLNRAHLKRQVEMEREQSQKLQEIDRMKSNFFASISHEFRTPLTLILGPLENYYQKMKNKKNREQFEIMLRNGRRLLKLINQLLDFSRLEAGSLKLEASETDIVFFIKRIVGSFMSLAERRQITLQFESSNKVVMCYVDHDKFEKIITNLISNAFKFTPEGGRISISVEKRTTGNSKGPWIEIAVQDNGVGIPQDQLDSVFDRFYQVDATRTRRHEGAGIGLALTKELVQLHRGEISVDSAENEGSTFIVRLPLGRSHLSDNEIVAESVSETIFEPEVVEEFLDTDESRKKGTGQNSKLLIVEDNSDVRYYIRDFLADLYQIKEAEDGLQGLRMARDWLPDIIISDVMMPGMDGFELCKRIKTDERTSHIPVILLTARASESSKLNGLEIGADDYIIKPFNAKEVKVRAKNLIDQRRLLRCKFSKEIIVQPSEITVNSLDEQFLERAIRLVEEFMNDEQLTVEFLAHRIGTSRIHLNRKIKALTGQTAQQFIRTLRLKRGAMLLQKESGTVAEIAFQTGFRNPSHFAGCFKQHFNVTPSFYKRISRHHNI